MVHFLRDKNNNTLLEAMVYVDGYEHGEGKDYVEVRSGINVIHYSAFLLTASDRKTQNKIINIFYDLDELRGWLWENYFMVKKNIASEKDNVEKEVGRMFKNAAEQLGLYYVTD